LEKTPFFNGLIDDIKAAIRAQVAGDRSVLDNLRNEVKILKLDVRRIQPRQTTSVSLVGTDGDNNQLQFDPFLIQVVRVVDLRGRKAPVMTSLPRPVARRINMLVAHYTFANSETVHAIRFGRWILSFRSLRMPKSF